MFCRENTSIIKETFPGSLKVSDIPIIESHQFLCTRYRQVKRARRIVLEIESELCAFLTLSVPHCVLSFILIKPDSTGG